MRKEYSAAVTRPVTEEFTPEILDKIIAAIPDTGIKEHKNYQSGEKTYTYEDAENFGRRLALAIPNEILCATTNNAVHKGGFFDLLKKRAEERGLYQNVPYIKAGIDNLERTYIFQKAFVHPSQMRPQFNIIEKRLKPLVPKLHLNG